jgi:hypothetical protein
MKGVFVMTSDTTTAEDRLRELGLRLPDAPTPFGAYVPAVQNRNNLMEQPGGLRRRHALAEAANSSRIGFSGCPSVPRAMGKRAKRGFVAGAEIPTRSPG